MNTSQLKQMKRFRKGLHFMGVMFTLVGLFLLFNFSILLLDPESTITVNGVVTSEFNPKLRAVIFTASFTLIGVILLFVPKSILNKLFVWRQSLASTFSRDK